VSEAKAGLSDTHRTYNVASIEGDGLMYRATHIALSLGSILLCGCSVFPRHGGNLSGKIWCNSRYLPYVDEFAKQEFHAVGDRYKVAARGYPYAVAGSLALQSDGKKEHAFNLPKSMTHAADLDSRNESGFFASTYLYDPPGSPPEVVVAFRGTNDARDWIMHNFSPAPEQFDLARTYVVNVARRYPDRRLVVAGFSLGGGLAVHVTQHAATSPLIKEAWAFNPSPRNGVKDSVDSRIWMAAVEGEILNLFRAGSSGAPDGQHSQRFNLVSSSSIFGHYRYVLTRQILHFADLNDFVVSGRTRSTTPALEILQASDQSHCRSFPLGTTLAQ
jgi:dienelactone hydrolase